MVFPFVHSCAYWSILCSPLLKNWAFLIKPYVGPMQKGIGQTFGPFPPPENRWGVPDSWLVWTDYLPKLFCKNCSQFTMCLLCEDLIKNTIIKLYLHNSKYATMLLKAHTLCWKSLNFDFTLKHDVIIPPNKQNTKSKQQSRVSASQSTDGSKQLCALTCEYISKRLCYQKLPLSGMSLKSFYCLWLLFLTHLWSPEWDFNLLMSRKC